MIHSTRLSLTAAGLAILACLTAVVAAFLPPRGHPPLSDYIGAIAVPVAWVLAIIGLGSAIASRRSVDRGRYLLALTANIAALASGCAVWFLWSFLRAV
ncbi:MAG: hypothetical protein R3344_09895 [Acidobacteriota bacterium]|nr:hypothetical protein [Acidobacteriota bacterium]